MLQILVIHRDLSHHVAWHITGEAARLTMIETIRVCVSKHLAECRVWRFLGFEILLGHSININRHVGPDASKRQVETENVKRK